MVDTITLTSPNGGEVWTPGSVHNITWTSVGIYPHPKIELYKGGSFNREIVFSSPTIDTYSWTVPTDLVNGTDYKINIMGCSGTSTGCSSPTTYPTDMSNANFTIGSGGITDDGTWRCAGVNTGVCEQKGTLGYSSDYICKTSAGCALVVTKVCNDPLKLGCTMGIPNTYLAGVGGLLLIMIMKK